MMDIYNEIVAVKNKGEDVALVTIISTDGSTPREEGAKMLVKTDGSIVGTIGGGNLENIAIKEALKVIQSGKPKHLEYNLKAGEETGMICGGDVEIFIEPILSTPTICIFGGGHIGLALASIGKIVGFKIIVVDDRVEFANPERFPEVDKTIVADFGDAFSKLKIDRSSYIVIMTHGHKGDEIVLEGALNTNAHYIGMIGSKSKIEAVYSHLRKKGFSQEQIGRIHSPIGLKISAETPEEIAISIMAEIIAVRRGQPK
jgi:xanthine dehydrogenase accessory factor